MAMRQLLNHQARRAMITMVTSGGKNMRTSVKNETVGSMTLVTKLNSHSTCVVNQSTTASTHSARGSFGSSPLDTFPHLFSGQRPDD